MIAQVTSRLIVNRTALKTRPEAVGALIARFRAALAGMTAAPADRATPGFAGGVPRPAARRRARPRPRWTAPVAAIIADVRAPGRRGALRLHAAVRPADARAGRGCGSRPTRSRPRRPSIAPRPGRRAGPRGRAGSRRSTGRRCRPISRCTDAAGLTLGHALDAARRGRPLRAGRQGGLSVLRADERDAGARRRRRADRHVRAVPRRRAEPARARGGAARRRVARSTASAARRRSRRWPTAPRPSRRWTASSGPATPTSPKPSGRCSAASASTASPGRRRSWSWPTRRRTRATSRWTCWRRPSTTRARRAS